MATTIRCSARSATARSSARAVAVTRPRAVVVRAQQQDARVEVTRRSALALSVAGLFASAAPAQAFLGFGDDSSLFEKYSTTTAELLAKCKAVIDLPKDDETKEDRVKVLRQDINSWVATYRREPKVSGRPSYGNTYSVVNALSGHYNSFGATAPIPKKRLERVVKEIEDAQLFLSRNR